MMINFIICDDSEVDRKRVSMVIDKFMMQNQLSYKKYFFSDYDDAFLKMVKSSLPSKIYILDIEMPTRSGIDVARIIRNIDINSLLIFLTGHNELAETIIKNDFLFVAFINKFDNCEKRLEKTLVACKKLLGKKKYLRLKERSAIYTIDFDDILYITRDSVGRKSIIVTDYSEFKVGESLNSIENKLYGNFLRTHRSCIVNVNRVVLIDKAKKIIKFDNNFEIDLISKKIKYD